MSFLPEITINGKHASFLKALVRKNAKDIAENENENSEKKEINDSALIYERYIDVYLNAALWGILYGRMERPDYSTRDRARIYADALDNEDENCRFMYRLVLLLDRTVKLSQNERIDRAFRYDSQSKNDERFRENIRIFNDYVRGGLSIMFEKFYQGGITQDDYINKSFSALDSLKKKIDNVPLDERLAELLKEEH